MFETTFSILKLFEFTSEINGRKKLQKIVHILEDKGSDFAFDFTYHHFGPYSFQLQEEVNTLVKQGFLEESHLGDGYTYVLTEKGNEFRRQLEDVGFKLELNRKFIDKLTSHSAQFLEVVSTYAYLLEVGNSPDEAKDKALELKPHLSRYIDDAINFYNNDLVVS